MPLYDIGAVPVKRTKMLSVRVSDADFRRLEDDALKSGHANLSTYLREIFLKRRESEIGPQDAFDMWLMPQEIKHELNALSRDQMESKALLATVVYLIYKSASPALSSQLCTSLRVEGGAMELFNQLPPELRQLVQSPQSE